MKISQILYEHVRALWDEALGKPFVREMALGTLCMDRFRYYMLQDYLYLMDYIGILEETLKHTRNPELCTFLTHIIEATKSETERVHVPNMKKIGITREDIRKCEKAEVIVNYVDYMRRKTEESGLHAGLAALLQCSWAYAYIGRQMSEKYPEEIAKSPFKNWFDAYTCSDYVTENQRWIDALDQETQNVHPEEVKALCSIFETCARYENQFWDTLYNGSL